MEQLDFENFFFFFGLMGKWWVWKNCDQTNVWLPMYLLGRRIRSSCSSFFICLNFCLGCPFGFSTQQALSLSFFLLSFCVDFPFRFSMYFFLFFFFFDKPKKGNNIIYNHFQMWCFQTTTSDMVFLQLIHVGWLSERVCV